MREPSEAGVGAARPTLGEDPGGPLVLLGNFEVEDHWAEGELGLPRPPFSGGRAVVNRLDELALLLAGPGDHVVLKAPPDDDWLAYLRSLGVRLPGILAVRDQDPGRTVGEDAVEDTALKAELARLAEGGARLWPHGVSRVEERLAGLTGLRLATAPAAVCKAVNSKIYSRGLNAEYGLRQPEGRTCKDLDEFADACLWARERLGRGGTVVLKDAFGVSGKGVLVVAETAALDRVQRMITRRAERQGRRDLALLVEEWVAKRADLNYQFTVGRDGTVRFDFVREALTEGGVHAGHWMPPHLTDRQQSQVREVAAVLGRRLAADGYFGVVGVDAMVDPDGGLYPVVEINARNNMSTYQERLRSTLLADAAGTALAGHFPLRPARPVPFAELRDRLRGLLFDTGTGTGFLVNDFATVNAAATRPDRPEGPFDGRLYGITVAASRQEATALHRAVADRLGDLSRPGGTRTGEPHRERSTT
ncbi:preATP grasp domain-containing protein [Streptomyces fradiae]|uniref:preATP grasp domain-containing protein n=1 Tax=Streptomyces fradiae TaxID=1906 RepID=UPI0037019710